MYWSEYDSMRFRPSIYGMLAIDDKGTVDTSNEVEDRPIKRSWDDIDSDYDEDIIDMPLD